MLRKVDKNGIFIVVNNNPNLVVPVSDDVVLLSGDNILHEFGAWQLGLDYLNGLANRVNLSCVIFGNDTFCHHRQMGAVEKFSFSRSFTMAKREVRPFASGEVTSYGGSFVLDGVSANGWICTYLFSINRAALDLLNWRIHEAYTEVKKWVPGGNDEASFFRSTMDESLKSHLTGWLFGRPGLPRWYRSEPLQESNEKFFCDKALTIMCEKLLTVRLMRSDVNIYSVFEPWLIAGVRRLSSRIQSKIGWF